MAATAQARNRLAPCEYSAAFREAIVALHRGKEHLPFYQAYITAHLGGPDSRLSKFEQYLYPEMVYRCGELGSKRILDVGCGTGASTAVLAVHCRDVTAFDIDPTSARICRMRLEEHGLSDRVQVVCAPSLEEVADRLGRFDLVLLNAVLEHIPLSQAGRRQRLLLTIFDILRPSGYLYINETPNRLWPVDHHTTGLWWIPWSRPGSRWAYTRAVRAGRHRDNALTHSDGPLGLEERGAWGATFFEICRYLSGKPYRVLNLCAPYDRYLSYVRSQTSRRRRLLDLLVYWGFTRWTKLPITAIWPDLAHLVIQRGDA